jgi:hypothetical protein
MSNFSGLKRKVLDRMEIIPSVGGDITIRAGEIPFNSGVVYFLVVGCNVIRPQNVDEYQTELAMDV